MACFYFQSGLIEKEVIKGDLKWIFEKRSGSGVYNAYKFLPRRKEMVVFNNSTVRYTAKSSFLLESRSSQIPFEAQFLDLLLVLKKIKVPCAYHLVLHLWASLMHWGECSAE